MPNRRKKSFKDHRERNIKAGKITRLSTQEKRDGVKRECPKCSSANCTC